jgi:amidophosphoribosyltransferase
MFEWVYFASPESMIDQVPVYGARLEFGNQLANRVRKELASRGLSADIVVPVPETSRIAAIALAEELGIPYREVLIKNRYIKRTFILDSQDKRQKAVNLKLSPVKSEIAGKRVLLVDDSIVRGTTSKKIIDLVRKAGADKVYIVSTCPPIRKPCYYGIDFPSESELIAGELDHEAIEKELQADAVIYQTMEGLKNAISDAERVPKGSKTFGSNPCTACLDGKYPTDISTSGKTFSASRTADRREKKGAESPL